MCIEPLIEDVCSKPDMTVFQSEAERKIAQVQAARAQMQQIRKKLFFNTNFAAQSSSESNDSKLCASPNTCPEPVNSTFTGLLPSILDS